MQHFITLYDVAYDSFKTFRTNLAWQSNRDVTGGVETSKIKAKARRTQYNINKSTNEMLIVGLKPTINISFACSYYR